MTTYYGSNTTEASADLQVDSTTGGALLPRMTTTQRDAISTPATGLEIYNTTTNQKDFYDGSSWGAVGGGASSQAVTYIVAASDAIDTTGADYVCDGTADDVQIQAAIDAVDAAGFGTVYLSEGTFTFASPVVIDASNTTLHGAGRGLTTLSGLTSADGYIELAPGTGNTIRDITLSDFTISGDASGTAATIGQIFQDDDGVIERLLIERIRITGTSSTLNGITFENATGTNKWVMIRDVTIELSAANIYGISFRKTTQYLWVEDCHVELSSSSSYNAIAVYADCEDFHINNNYATSGHSPIGVSPANNGEIVGNIVDGMNVTSEGGIEVEWKSSHNGLDTSHHIVVANNIVRGGYWGVFVTRRDTDAPNPGEPTDIIIANNVIENPSSDAIRVSYGTRVSLRGNVLRNAGAHGIGLLTTTDVLVEGNIITDPTSVGIRSEGATSDSAVVINGNIIDGAGSDGVLLESGSGNYIVKNNYIDGVGGYGLHTKTNNGVIVDNWVGTAASGVVNDTGTDNVFARNSNDPQNAVHLDGASEISTLTEDTSPASGDWIITEDVSDGGAKKKVQIGNLPSGGGSGFPNYGASSTKTLSSDAIAVGSDRNIVVAAESGTTDDLAEITGLTVGDSVILRADAGDTITVKHNDAGATVKILMLDDADLILDENHPIEFVLVDTNELHQVFDEVGSGGGSLPTTTKGDIVVHNGSTDIRIGVGTDGQYLEADSTEPSGVKWATPSGGGGSFSKTTKTIKTETLLWDLTLASDGMFDTNDTPDAGSASPTFSDYDSLHVVFNGVSDVASNVDEIQLFFNNDKTVSNYFSIRNGSGAQNDTVIGNAAGQTSDSGSVGAIFVDIINHANPSYRTSAITKTGYRRHSSEASARSSVMEWESTTTVTRLQLEVDNGTAYEAGSRMTVYGVKNETVVTDVTSGAIETSDANVSSPPTDAELDSAFGTPATVGDGFIGLLDDNGAGTAVYLAAVVGANWWTTAMTKAA